MSYNDSEALISQSLVNLINNNSDQHSDQTLNATNEVTKAFLSEISFSSTTTPALNAETTSTLTNNEVEKKMRNHEPAFIFPRFNSSPKTTTVSPIRSLSSLKSSTRERFFATSECDAQTILQDRRGSLHSPGYPFSIPVKHHYYEREVNSSSLTKRNKCSWIIHGSKKEDVVTVRFVFHSKKSCRHHWSFLTDHATVVPVFV